MAKSSLVRFTCFASLLSLASCAAPAGPSGEPGTGGSTSTGGATGGSTSTGGNTGVGGSTSTGGSSTGGSSTGGSTTTGGNGGSSSTAGTGGSSTGNGGRGGSSVAGTGGSSTAGTGGSSTGGTAGTGVRVDQGGIPLAKIGDMTTASRAYLNLGDMRLINNRWGSDELRCAGTTQRVFINTDRSLGWEFNRPICGGDKGKPDYPEVEFGIAPFGTNSTLLTTPAFSTTTLLPKQIKDLTGVNTVKVDGMTITLSKPTIWNIDFELWLSQRNPATDPNPGVYAEIIVFWGWETGRWACDKSGTVTAGNNTYQLCHQSDTWANGQWRFYQFNVVGGPLTSYSGTVDAKALIDFVVNTYGLSRDLWVTRFEVGSEIDDNTAGSVKVRNLTFTVNGTSKSVELQ